MRSKEAGECFCTKKLKQILLRRGAGAFAELNEKYSKIKRFLSAQSAKYRKKVIVQRRRYILRLQGPVSYTHLTLPTN